MEQFHTVLEKLVSIATQEEKIIILSVAVKAGYYWKCTCPNYLPRDQESCPDCKEPRPKELSVPVEKIHITWYGRTLCGLQLETAKQVTVAQSSKATCDICMDRFYLYYPRNLVSGG